MSRFEPRGLATYDDAALIAELQRVAVLATERYLTVSAFDRLSRIGATTVRRRFGSWRAALAAADLTARFNDANKPRSKEEILAEIRRIADESEVPFVTKSLFRAKSSFGDGSVSTYFKSWNEAVREAGVSGEPAKRVYSDEECFENLLSVWSFYGRQPTYAEMFRSPSTIAPKTYARRWGGWRSAVRAFAVRANETVAEELPTFTREAYVAVDPNLTDRGPRLPALGLRYRVLARDRFCCVLCGASPAKTIGCQLHVDHIVPYSRGGKTEESNLRTLCLPCNLGKGDRPEPDA